MSGRKNKGVRILTLEPETRNGVKGYAYALGTSLQSEALITGWKAGNKADVEAMLKKPADRLCGMRDWNKFTLGGSKQLEALNV